MKMRETSRGKDKKPCVNNYLTWANQVRILGQSFEQLGGIIGGVLINAFKPFLAALNQVMQRVIQFAQTVANALGKIFGWTFEISGGGTISDDFEDIATSTEDTAGNLDDAADSMKKLNKYIAAWHEVNNMTTSDSGAGSGGSGGGGGAGGLGATGDIGRLVKTDSLLDQYESEIDSLYELGEYIGKVLTDAMNSINWPAIYESARNFGTGLAQFMNGLISPELFGALGRTIAGSLNTALWFLNSYGTEFDWTDFGLSIATGINEFFRTFDFKLLANTINVWAKGILDTAITALDNVNWKQIGTQIGTFLDEIDVLKIMGKLAQAIWKALNAALETYSNIFSTAPVETAILSIVAVTKLLKTTQVKKFVDVLKNAIFIVQNFGGAFVGVSANLTALYSRFPRLAKAVDVLGSSFQTLMFGIHAGDPLGGINTAIKNITNNLTGLQKGVITAVSGFAEFSLVQGSISDLLTGTGDLATNLMKLAGGAAIGAAGMYTALGPAGLAVAAITGLIALITGFSDAVEELGQNTGIGQFSSAIDELNANVAEKTAEIRDNISDSMTTIQDAGVAETAMARDLADEFQNLSDKTYLSAEQQERLQWISGQLVELVPELSGYIDEQTGILDIQSDTLTSLIDNMELYAKQQAAQEMLVDAYKQQYEAQKNVADAQEAYNSAVEDYINSSSAAPELLKQIANGTLDMQNVYKDWDNLSQVDFMEKYGLTDVGAVAAEMDLFNEKTKEFQTTLSDAQTVESETKNNIEDLKNEFANCTNAIADNNAEIDAARKNTTEYKQALSDIRQEFSDTGITITDEFADALASLGDMDSASAIIEMFGKMKSQVQLSSNELATLFSTIAPGMSNEFITALAEQEPEMQSRVSMAIANIASGAQISADDAAKVFESIGFQLPDATMAAFLKQESPMQLSTINLLSKIEEGKSLVEENLLYVFDMLGINVSDSVINAMADMEPEVQQQAISLIAQISEAEESERGPLIEQLRNLGIDIGEDGLISGIDSQQGGVYTSGATLVNKSVEGGASVDAPGQMKNLGEDAAWGYARGLGNSEALKTIVETGKNMALAAIQSIQETQNSHSPSKETMKLGQYFAEGFNLGISDEAESTPDLIKKWISGLINGFDYQMQVPTIDLSVDTSQYKPQRMNVNTDKLSSDIQESLSYLLTMDGVIDYNRLGEAVYQAQTQAMQENPVRIGDADVFKSAQRGQRQEYRRTRRVGWAGID